MFRICYYKLSVIPTLDKFILPCGTKFVRVQLFAIFPAIRRNRLLQIKFTGNIFPEKFYSRANITYSEFATQKYNRTKSCLFLNRHDNWFPSSRNKMVYNQLLILHTHTVVLFENMYFHYTYVPKTKII